MKLIKKLKEYTDKETGEVKKYYQVYVVVTAGDNEKYIAVRACSEDNKQLLKLFAETVA